jgi:hypothetical protein
MSNVWGMSEEAQEIARQDLNNAPREQAAPVPMAEEPRLPLTQPIPQEHLFQQRLVVRENAGDERPAQRPRTIPPFGQPGSSPRFPSELIFPPMVTRTPNRPAPSAENLLAPWHGDLLHDTSTSLVIVLQKGQMEDGGPELTFQAIYKGLNRDQSWGMDVYHRHPVDRGVGHFRWLHGQLVILPPEDQAGHVADIVQRVLRFLGWPATNQQN